MQSKDKPYVLYVAEVIYLEISEIKKKNSNFSNKEAIDAFIDLKTNKKIPEETIRLLKIQKDVMVKQLIRFPDLYDTKNNLPLEISQRAFDHIWRMCESYELWCKETKQNEFIQLNITD